MGVFLNKLHSQTAQKLKLTNCSIADASYNEHTKIVSACTTDGRVILTSLRNGDGESASQVSTIQIIIDSIAKFVWTSNYEFAVVGSDQSLHCFSIMNLRSDVFPIHTGSISTVKREGALLYTGSADGSVGVWDQRSEHTADMLSHTHRGKPQPIKGLEVHSSHLYSSSIYKGRMWVWDLRHTRKCLNSVEARCCQNSLGFFRGNLYSVSDVGILKTSPCLEFSEVVHRESSAQTCPRSHIGYSERFGAVVWSTGSSMEVQELPFPGSTGHESTGSAGHVSLFAPGINGFELCESDKMLLFNCEGEVTVERLQKRHEIDSTDRL